MTKPTEHSAVQRPLIHYAVAIGWDYISPSEAIALRKGEGGLLFSRTLEERLIKLNPGVITKSNVGEVCRRIEESPNSIEGNAEILGWLRGEQAIFIEGENRTRNVIVIDFFELKNNVFQVTDEWQYTNGQETNRADVMFLINGIPVAIVETKNAANARGIEAALIQMREYHNETPELLTAPQVFALTNLIDFYYGVTWNTDRKNLFKWRSSPLGASVPSMAKESYEERVKSFFNRDRFLKMLKEWILFFYKEDELQKTVLRQHQTRAVDQILERCADQTKTSGLIWHTQGSGKTFTMITAARLILQDRERFGKATVLLMIDRNELEGQLSGWVERILGESSTHDISVKSATSKKNLQELLSSDFRGLIVSMIHKFDNIQKEINTRESIYVLIDEAHRTTGGDLGTYLMAALPHATLIGFTGTPIDKTAYGKGTFKVFGGQDADGYLDKYSIAQSIEDKTTLPLKYTLAPNEIRVPQDILEEEFLNIAQAEGVSDVEELNKILDHAMRLKTFLKSESRVAEVAAFVANHFTENVAPLGYKAFLVAVDREACALYKEALDLILPAEWSMPIYTSAQHDSVKLPLVYKHQITPQDEKKARKLFPKAEKQPKILIVTDKLLTGFDAPVLYCMYLDKPMRDHVLLQAIARVNRPYECDAESHKPCGLVVDFVGIFNNLKKALAFDSDVVSGVIEDIDLLFDKFKELMETEAQPYLRLCQGAMDDKVIERAIEALLELEKHEDFYKLFKQLETLYEILSPSPLLRDYLDDFGSLSFLYQIMRNTFRKHTTLYGDVARKTELLVREKAVSYGVSTILPVVTIDATTLEAINTANSSDKGKVINLINKVRKTIADDEEQNPYLKPIGDRAEAIMEAYDGRRESTAEVLKKIKAIISEILDARKQQENSGLDQQTFPLFWTLKQESIEEPDKAAQLFRSIFDRHPHHRDNASELRLLKAELYKTLLPMVGKEKMIAVADKLLKVEAT